MTEADWLTSSDPTPMLTSLRGKASERKLRLITVACARLLWDRIPPGELREAVEAAERCADGTPWEAELAGYCHRLYDVARIRDRAEEEIGVHLSVLETTVSPNAILRGSGQSSVKSRFTLPLTGQRRPDLIRDVIGNPFRPVPADPRWLTSTATGLAHAIYEDRAWDRLPILADALEDAGCGNTEVLGHLRGDGPHARGCWAVDLILGKS